MKRGDTVKYFLMNKTAIVLMVEEGTDRVLVNWDGWKRNIWMDATELEAVEKEGESN